MLSKREIEKLKHDLKRASKAIVLIRDEKNKNRRDIIAGLLTDELDRLSEDLDDLLEKDETGG